MSFTSVFMRRVRPGQLATSRAYQAEQLAVLLLEGGGGGGVEHAAQLAALFIEGDAVAPLGADQRGLHAADAAADDRDLPGVGGGLDAVFAGLHGAGVQRAAGHAPGVRQGLGVGVALEVGQG